MNRAEHPDPNAPIVCRVTAWYYRRMGLLAAMFLGMGCYFFYDGRIGYVKENRIAAEKERFEREIIGSGEKRDREIESYEEALKQGEEYTAAWVAMARERGWIVSPTLKEPRWDDYAAPRGWAENPKKHSEDEIRQQFYWGAAMILGAVIAGTLVLRNHNKVFTGYPDHMVMPNGVSVRFADATCVDKRKWDNKGLAYIHYREAEGMPSRRVTVDDLMFGGAGKVLERLLSQFKGELIEKVPDDEVREEVPETGQSPAGDMPAKDA
jgi:hypothetical protein